MEQALKRRTFKQMMYVSIISMIMMFAGLTSAYVISMQREDWVSFELPNALYISTLMIILSSLTYFLAKKSIKQNKLDQTALFVGITLVLALAFVYFQIQAFDQLRAAGLFFTGEGSVVSSSLLVAISFAHLLHVMAGVIVLSTVLINTLRKKYTAEDHIGLEVGGIFWHFVDILWIFLFVFFYFIK